MTAGKVSSELEISALLCSRVCHDVIGPVGAIINGLEVLDDDDDGEMRDIAFDLIRKSARQASAKLQFCRLAFGAAGSAGAELDLGDAQQVVETLLADEKITLDWAAPHETRPKNQVKLLLNLVLIAMGSIPRGGTLTVSMQGDAMQVSAAGEGAAVPQITEQMFAGNPPEDGLDARSVQLHYALELASALGLDVAADAAEGRVEIFARPRAEAAA